MDWLTLPNLKTRVDRAYTGERLRSGNGSALSHTGGTDEKQKRTG
jgi:hypothetical protein